MQMLGSAFISAQYSFSDFRNAGGGVVTFVRDHDDLLDVLALPSQVRDGNTTRGAVGRPDTCERPLPVSQVVTLGSQLVSQRVERVHEEILLTYGRDHRTDTLTKFDCRLHRCRLVDQQRGGDA